MRKRRFVTGLLELACSGILLAANGAGGEPTIRIRSLDSATPVLRAQRPATIEAVIENAGSTAVEMAPKLLLPAGVRAVREPPAAVRIGSGDEATLAWTITADGSTQGELTLQVHAGTVLAATRSLAVQILEPVAMRALPYLPEPEPIQLPLLIGAHHCPLWEAAQPQMWANVRKHPERTPALGFYAQENPEVSDWETKWAVEHGISFFIYCWYRSVQGEPVKMRFGTAIHDALLKSKFVDQMKFTIMWENQSRGQAGVADERDLLDNLLPFWIDNYFRHPSYLKIDGRPVLFIYRPEFLIQDLGGVDHVARALGRLRQALPV
jgi:Glycosyltransferase WbsX